MLVAIAACGGPVGDCGGAPHDRADARGELAEAEWLRDVVVGPELEPRDAIVLARTRRQHDDGHVSQIRSRLDDPADLQAVHHRQIEIQDHQIRRTFGHRLQRGVAAEDDVGLGVGIAFERVFDEARDVALVFHDQNAVLWHGLQAQGLGPGVDATMPRAKSLEPKASQVDVSHPYRSC